MWAVSEQVTELPGTLPTIWTLRDVAVTALEDGDCVVSIRAGNEIAEAVLSRQLAADMAMAVLRWAEEASE